MASKGPGAALVAAERENEASIIFNTIGF